MSNFIEIWNPALLVSIGAILGAYSRLQITSISEFLFRKKSLGTFIVNIISTFLLGLSFSFYSQPELLIESKSLVLIFCIGFLGSLSTFSTFIMELFIYLIENRLKQFLYILSLTIFGSLFVLYLVYIYGDVQV